MPKAEKTTEVVSYKELKEKHSKKTAIEQTKAKIEEDYSNNGKIFQIEIARCGETWTITMKQPRPQLCNKRIMKWFKKVRL